MLDEDDNHSVSVDVAGFHSENGEVDAGESGLDKVTPPRGPEGEGGRGLGFDLSIPISLQHPEPATALGLPSPSGDSSTASHMLSMHGDETRPSKQRKSGRSEPTSDEQPHDEGQARGQDQDGTVWGYERILACRVNAEGKVLSVKVQWKPTWEPVSELDDADEALAAFDEKRRHRQARAGPFCKHRSGRRKLGRRKNGR